jgi:hypothetical protein
VVSFIYVHKGIAATLNNNIPEDDQSGKKICRFKGRRHWIVLPILLLAVFAGIYTGNRLSDRLSAKNNQLYVDEYTGLGARTGLTGELKLSVTPMKLSARLGEPAQVEITITNRGKKSIRLNGWMKPLPSSFNSNQFPVRVLMKYEGRPMEHKGSLKVMPAHLKKDFLTLKPYESHSFTVDLTKLGWNLSKPGAYSAEFWYETYLSGRYAGVKAWTGMTNHAIVQLTVRH